MVKLKSKNRVGLVKEFSDSAAVEAKKLGWEEITAKPKKIKEVVKSKGAK